MWSDRDWECYPTALRFDLTWRLTEKGWKPDGWTNGRPVIPRVGPHIYETQWPLVEEVAQSLLDDIAAATPAIPPPKETARKKPEKAEPPPKKASPNKKVPAKKTASKTTKRRVPKKKE